MAASGAVLLAGCTATGTTERNAGYGAAAGAVAGAVIRNNSGDGDPRKGPVIGAALAGPALPTHRRQPSQARHPHRPQDHHGAHVSG